MSRTNGLDFEPATGALWTTVNERYALGAHTVALGLAFYEGSALPKRFHGGAFVAQHGSWNRRPLSGYRVVFVPFVGGEPVGLPGE